MPLIPQQELLQWSDNIARELSQYKSQYSGMKSFNAGISIPMVFAGNLSATTGSTVGVTETAGETNGTTEGLSDSYSHTFLPFGSAMLHVRHNRQRICKGLGSREYGA